MDIEAGKTPDGQDFIKFKTQYNETCTVVAGEKMLRCAIRDKDDTSLHAPFTLFTREQVRAILPYLQSFEHTGSFGIEQEEEEE